MKYFLSFTFFIVLINVSFSQTIYTVQDGSWNDSAVWSNNQPLSYSVYGDSIIINHHVSIDSTLVFDHCYIQLNDTGASICGYDTILLYHSYLYHHGGNIFCYWFFWGDSSFYFCDNDGFSIWRLGAGYFGEAAGDSVGVFTDGCHGIISNRMHFTCTPLAYWQDSSDTNPPPDTITTYPPPTFTIYPNPFLDYVTAESDIPDSYNNVQLEVYDILGRRLQSYPILTGKYTYTIADINWAAGMYFFRFESGGKSLYSLPMVRVQ